MTDKKISKTVIKPGYEGNAPKTIEEFVHKYESSLTFKNIQRRLDEGVIGSAPRMNEISDEVKSVYSQECLQSLSRQLILLTKRATRLSWDRSTVVVQFLSQFLIALIIGSLFFRLPLTSSGAYSRGSVLFMVCTTYAIGTVLDGTTQRHIAAKNGPCSPMSLLFLEKLSFRCSEECRCQV